MMFARALKDLAYSGFARINEASACMHALLVGKGIGVDYVLRVLRYRQYPFCEPWALLYNSFQILTWPTCLNMPHPISITTGKGIGVDYVVRVLHYRQYPFCEPWALLNNSFQILT
jgi:hypothetical protein